MAHVDDGKLNALLDGELDAAEATVIRGHLAGCPDCSRRLEEARRFLAGAAEVLGDLEPPLPGAQAVGAAAGWRASRTAKEAAVDLDGATQKSPALGPGPGEAHAAPLFRSRPPRRALDYTSLAWAATIALAIGVGFLGNEVLHARAAARAAAAGQRGAPGGAAGAGTGTAASAPAPSTPASPAAAAAPVAGTGGRAPSLPRPKTLNPRGATTVLGRKHLDARAAAAGARPAPAPDSQPALAPAAPAFRRVPLERAVDRLGGAVRLIDGLRSARVETGPGSLVAGARRDAPVVRVVYVEGGLRITLDQQRVDGQADTAAAGPAAEGAGAAPALSIGDTAFTTAADGANSMRWLDGRGFWLELTAQLPPESLRQLAIRVR